MGKKNTNLLHSNKNFEFDIVISGASYIGMSLACVLAKYGLKIALIGNKYNNYYIQKTLPSRQFAINVASIQFFQDIGIKKLLEDTSQPINQVIVEDLINHKQLIFDPNDLNLKNFGFMVDENCLSQSLLSIIKQYKNIIFYTKNQIIHIKNSIYSINLLLSNQYLLTSKLLIIAEGKNSRLRELIGIRTNKISYNQDAIVFNITHEMSHNGIAVEKFFQSGPFAILPKKNYYQSCIVWTDIVNTGKLITSMAKNDVAYLVSKKLDNMLGKIKISSDIIYFPLNLMYADNYFKGNSILCGDAMHNIHPIAGQGLNLGLRDVQLLGKLIKNNINLGLPINSVTLLDYYNQQRECDINFMINSTHCINAIYSTEILPIQLLRKIGSNMINKVAPIRRYILHYASGFCNL